MCAAQAISIKDKNHQQERLRRVGDKADGGRGAGRLTAGPRAEQGAGGWVGAREGGSRAEPCSWEGKGGPSTSGLPWVQEPLAGRR